MNSNTPIKVILIPILAVCFIVAALLFAVANKSVTSADGVDCSVDYWNSEDIKVINTCGEQKLANMLAFEDMQATTTLLPPPVPTQPVIAYTPGPILPQPEAFKVIREWDRSPNTGPVPAGVRNATSIWDDGSVPNRDYSIWDALIVVSRPGNGITYTLSFAGGGGVYTTTGNPTIETMVYSSVTGDPYMSTFDKRWESPAPVRELIITDITNPDYTNTDPTVPYPGLRSVVYFRTPGGQTGSFDMATETWTFKTP